MFLFYDFILPCVSPVNKDKYFFLFVPPEIVKVFDLVNQEKVFEGKTLYKHYSIEPIYLGNNTVLFAGGCNIPSTVGCNEHNKSEIFDFVSNKFYETGDLTCGTFTSHYKILNNENVLIFGSCPSSSYRIIKEGKEIGFSHMLAEIYISE